MTLTRSTTNCGTIINIMTVTVMPHHDQLSTPLTKKGVTYCHGCHCEKKAKHNNVCFVMFDNGDFLILESDAVVENFPTLVCPEVGYEFDSCLVADLHDCPLQVRICSLDWCQFWKSTFFLIQPFGCPIIYCHSISLGHVSLLEALKSLNIVTKQFLFTLLTGKALGWQHCITLNECLRSYNGGTTSSHFE